MKTKTVRLAAFALVATLRLFGADPDIFTQGHLNGRGWGALTHDTKIFYILGVVDILSYLAGDNDHLILVPGITQGERSAALDLFYSDPVNADVPVVGALMIVRLRKVGADPGKVEEVAAMLRKSAAVPESARAAK